MKKQYYSPEVDVDLIVIERNYLATGLAAGANLNDPNSVVDPWDD